MKKLCALVLVAPLVLSVLGGVGWCKNFVYKGTLSETDLVTNKSASIAGYIVFGDAMPVDNNESTYFIVSSSLIAINGVLGTSAT